MMRDRWFKLKPILLMEEILQIGSLSHFLQVFIHPRWLAGFFPSTVLLANEVLPVSAGLDSAV